MYLLAKRQQKNTQESRWNGLLFLTAILWCAVAHSQAESTILLRNVAITKVGDDSSDLTVNILIRNNNLDIVTEDSIPLDDVDVAYDASGGYVLGKLQLGQLANFLVLNGDPGKNLNVILDTKAHTLFAIQDGVVLTNRFVTVVEETPEEKASASQGWLAYSPPPLILALNYEDTSRWNHFQTKYVNGLFVGAVVLDRMNWQGQNGVSVDQVEDLTVFDGGEIRAFRLGAAGTINFKKPWIWTLAGATHAFDKGFDTEVTDDFTIYDLRLDIPLYEKASFSIGKQKEPISMERIMAMTDMPMQERAAVSDSLLPSRNVGVVMAGNLFDENVTLAGGIFNNWLDKDQPASRGDNATQFVGRATWLPYASDNESTILHLGGGVRYSNGKEGASARAGPEFGRAPDYMDVSLSGTDSIYTYQGEASLRSGPFWLHGEYIRSDFDAPVEGDISFQGYHVTASWIVSGEVRPYNRRVGVFGGIPIARGVDQNGWGAWEISSRFSHMDMNDGIVDGGEMDIWSAGLTWLPSPYLNIFFDYRYITLDQMSHEGTSHGFNSRIMILLD